MTFVKQQITEFSYINQIESYPDYESLTAYAIGSIVRDDNFYYKNAVQVLADNTLKPSENETYWVEVRPSNRYAWVDLSSTTITANENNIDGLPNEPIIAIFDNQFYNSIGFGNVLADSITVEFSSDGFVTIDESFEWENPSYLTPSSQSNKWDYRYGSRRGANEPYGKYFPISPRLGEIRVTITQSTVDDIASVGYMIAGQGQYVGCTLDKVSKSYKDFSVYSTDAFGTQKVTKRAIQQILDGSISADKVSSMSYDRIVRNLLATHVMAVADESDSSVFENLVMLCLIKRYDVTLSSSNSRNISTFRLEETI